MSGHRIAAVTITTVLLLSAIGWLARAPYRPDGSEHAILRLSWRTRGVRQESCRRRTPKELSALPVHMRTPTVCEGKTIPYHLVLRVGDRAPLTRRILPAGAKSDRPLYVFHEEGLAPGSYTIYVEFGSHTDAVALDTVIHVHRGDIALITLDPATGELVYRTRTNGQPIPASM